MFLAFAQISKKRVSDHNPSQSRDLAPYFGDLSQNEKLYDIKPPIAIVVSKLLKGLNR